MYIIKNSEVKSTSNVYAIKDSIVRSITNIYSIVGDRAALVWTAIKDAVSGVFGSGIWNKDEIWNNDDLWKNDL